MELNDILAVALKGGASDIHLKAGLPPMFRVDGALLPLRDGARLSGEDIKRMMYGIMSTAQRQKFEDDFEIDLAYGVPGLGRFRVNVFMQRSAVGAVFRVIPFRILTIEQLNLPPILEKIAQDERGLILVTGTTGSGKSTTLAALIDYINSTRTSHIITIEDPIEFLVRDKRSIVNQREIGVDTKSFSRALRSALREDPDVILVGEMRDLETIEIAMTAAETGHLVMSTLHTLDATETINRIIAAFPPFQQKQVRLQLAAILKCVVSQRLVPKMDGRGRVAAVEILRSTARVRELIEDKDRTRELHDAIGEGYTTYGMQTFDQSLMLLLTSKLISYEEALRQASNPDDFALRVSGVGGTSDNKWDHFDTSAPIPGRPAQGVPMSSIPMSSGMPNMSGMSGMSGMSSGMAPNMGGPTMSTPTMPVVPVRSAMSSAVSSTSNAAPATGNEEFTIERFGR